MIRSFRHKGLKRWHLKTDDRLLPSEEALAEKIKRVIEALDAARHPEAMRAFDPGLHLLKGKPRRWSVHVNGPWCITFEWQAPDALDVDLENYH